MAFWKRIFWPDFETQKPAFETRGLPGSFLGGLAPAPFIPARIAGMVGGKPPGFALCAPCGANDRAKESRMSTYKVKNPKTIGTVVSLNVSYKREIDAETLVSIFKTQDAALVESWESHLSVFFSEVPKAYVLGFMEENGITGDMVQAVHALLHPILQNPGFFEW